MAQKKEISVSKAADILGLTDRYVREAVAAGKIKGVKVAKLSQMICSPSYFP